MSVCLVGVFFSVGAGGLHWYTGKSSRTLFIVSSVSFHLFLYGNAAVIFFLVGGLI